MHLEGALELATRECSFEDIVVFNVFFLDVESYQPFLTFSLGSCMIGFYHARTNTPYLY